VISIAEKIKTTTSTEVKTRWMAKAYKNYNIHLRNEEDAELIAFVEKEKKENSINTTDYFRDLILDHKKNKGL